VTSGDL